MVSMRCEQALGVYAVQSHSFSCITYLYNAVDAVWLKCFGKFHDKKNHQALHK